MSENFFDLTGQVAVVTGTGQRSCKVLAEAAACAGDDGHLAGEVKEVLTHDATPAGSAVAASAFAVNTTFMRLGSCA